MVVITRTLSNLSLAIINEEVDDDEIGDNDYEADDNDDYNEEVDDLAENFHPFRFLSVAQQ